MILTLAVIGPVVGLNNLTVSLSNEGFSLEVVSFMDTIPHGLSATRVSGRPNPIWIFVVLLDRLINSNLQIRNIDFPDKTPLLDLEPFIPKSDYPENARSGWLEHTGKRSGQQDQIVGS